LDGELELEAALWYNIKVLSRVHTHTHTHTHTYIYIYIERERERERETKLYIGNLTQFNINCFSGYKFQAQLLVKARELQKDIDI